MSRDVPRAGWRSRKAGGAILVQTQKPRTRSAGQQVSQVKRREQTLLPSAFLVSSCPQWAG